MRIGVNENPLPTLEVLKSLRKPIIPNAQYSLSALTGGQSKKLKLSDNFGRVEGRGARVQS